MWVAAESEEAGAFTFNPTHLLMPWMVAVPGNIRIGACFLECSTMAQRIQGYDTQVHTYNVAIHWRLELLSLVSMVCLGQMLSQVAFEITG